MGIGRGESMTTTLAEPEPPHICVYRGMFGVGWTCCYGHWIAWSECPLDAAATVLAAASEGVGKWE